MKRTSKRYVVTSDSLNNYGYRVLTSGVDYSQYEKNPILLWMHQRATGNLKNQILPVGSAVDLQLEGTKITCFLEFDETDEFAMQLYNKYENGTLNMISLGALPIEWSDDPAQMLPGQTGPTFTKSKVTDISCVDMGGQDDACACQLYDANDRKLELADMRGEGLIKLFISLHKKTEDKLEMDKIELTGPALSGILLALKLDNKATDVQVQKAVNDLAQANIQLSGEIEGLKTAKTTAESELVKVQKDVAEAKIIKLVDDNVNKFLPAQREHFISLATANYASTEALLKGMAKIQSVAEIVTGKKTASDAAISLSWEELDHRNMLIQLKAENFELFKTKYYEKFNKEYGS